MRILVSIIAALIGLTGAGEALAQGAYAPSGFEIRGGVLAHDVPGLWSGFRLESGVDINAELLGSRCAPSRRHVAPGDRRVRQYAWLHSKAYLDARWEIDLRYGVFFGLGLGAAIHDGNLDPTEPDRKALGSRVCSTSPSSSAIASTSARASRRSSSTCRTAALADHNEALDSIGIRYGYRF